MTNTSLRLIREEKRRGEKRREEKSKTRTDQGIDTMTKRERERERSIK